LFSFETDISKRRTYYNIRAAADCNNLKAIQIGYLLRTLSRAHQNPEESAEDEWGSRSPAGSGTDGQEQHGFLVHEDSNAEGWTGSGDTLIDTDADRGGGGEPAPSAAAPPPPPPPTAAAERNGLDVEAGGGAAAADAAAAAGVATWARALRSEVSNASAGGWGLLRMDAGQYCRNSLKFTDGCGVMVYR
jgi:hypothetical protein